MRIRGYVALLLAMFMALSVGASTASAHHPKEKPPVVVAPKKVVPPVVVVPAPVASVQPAVPAPPASQPATPASQSGSSGGASYASVCVVTETDSQILRQEVRTTDANKVKADNPGSYDMERGSNCGITEEGKPHPVPNLTATAPTPNSTGETTAQAPVSEPVAVSPPDGQQTATVAPPGEPEGGPDVGTPDESPQEEAAVPDSGAPVKSKAAPYQVPDKPSGVTAPDDTPTGE